MDEDAFEALADGTRVGILRALAESRAGGPTDTKLSFSELRERVGVRDSGRFNYHLDKLRGHFVESTDEGYTLTPAGQLVASALVSGAYDPGVSRDPVEIDATCPVCDDRLSVSYEAGLLLVRCPENHGFGNSIPPATFDGRDVEAVVEVMTLVNQQEMETAIEGVCPLCRGSMPPEIVRATELGAPEWAPEYMFLAACERCGMILSHFVGACVVRHPAVVSLLYDHGIDVRERAAWELPFATAEPVVVSEDPLRLRVEVECGGDRVSLTLDDAASVVAVDADGE
jgi:hypothetical protein